MNWIAGNLYLIFTIYFLIIGIVWLLSMHQNNKKQRMLLLTLLICGAGAFLVLYNFYR